MSTHPAMGTGLTRAILVGGVATILVLLSRRSFRRAVQTRIEQVQRATAFLPATAGAVEWDYAGLLGLIAFWCERAARHHAEHRFVEGWERTERELRMAAALCR